MRTIFRRLAGFAGSQLQLADAKAQNLKVSVKLKRERELRLDMAEELARVKADAAETGRKYRQLLEMGGNAAGPVSIDDEYKALLAIASAPLDDNATRAHIDSYHATLDKKPYNHVWRERLDLILSVLATGERQLSRALATVRRAEERKRKMGFDNRRWVINDEYMELPWRPAAAAYRSAVFEAIHDRIRPNTTKIIETGSGWGEHLCNTFLEGGPVDAGYYALEMEEEGRKCSLLLGALDPMFRLEAHHFDYINPDYSAIPKDDGHTILLTAHSVEQVSEISEDCIYKALELGAHVSGIHIEPVGWQLSPEAEWTEISKEHHARCTELHYNRNLWSLLNRIQDRGRIKITEVRPNFIGLDYNPASLIAWEKVV